MIQNQEILKLYTAFRSGCLGDNVLDVYFSFFANILIEENVTDVEANDLCARFEQKYRFPIPLPFVRQVLSVGVRNSSIINFHGRYQVIAEKLFEHRADISGFESSWSNLLSDFKAFCLSIEYSYNEQTIESEILDYINSHDIGFILNQDAYSDYDTAPFDFAWNKYLQHISQNDTHLFNFMSAICFSNILKQAIFYTESSTDDFNGLCVYLDSPLVFSVLGMDDKERVESVRFLLKEMNSIGCNVLLLDHNFNEVKGIITTAGERATSANYDIARANNAARFFHDGKYDQQEIIEYIADVENHLSEYGISIKTTDYDVYENQFQEDEVKLYEMVAEKYAESGYAIPPEKEYSIKVDVQSIIMIYRIRQGVTSQTIQNAKHIMITQNSAIANVCKNYESNRSINSGHIPVCISMDLFGTVLWMYHPDKMLEYHRKQLLADCYSILKPSKKMLEKYLESLKSAKNAGEINEKKYLFMRSHPVVSDALMNVTKGDYARFNDKTYLEVFDDIIAKSEIKYMSEVAAHEKTKKKLNMQVTETEILNARIEQLEFQEQERFNKICKKKSVIWTIAVFGIPYILVLAISQLLISAFQGLSISALFGIGGILLIGIILDSILKKFVYLWVSKKVREHEESKRTE